jgi:hypothetical protein
MRLEGDKPIVHEINNMLHGLDRNIASSLSDYVDYVQESTNK